jgi:hypothetical protein
MAGHLWTYPDTALPAVSAILAHLRGDEDVPTAEVIHACWHLAGFGLSFADPHAPLVMEAFGEGEEEEPTAYLELAQTKLVQGFAPEEVGAVPWGMLALWAMRLALRLLSK